MVAGPLGDPAGANSMVRAEDRERLRATALFKPLTEEQLDELLRGSYLQRFPKGTLLFEEGESADFLHVLLEGSVELFARGSDAGETVVEIFWPVDCFILAAVLTDRPYLMSARTLEPSRLLLLEAGNVRRRIAADNGLALIMMGALAGHFRRMVRQIKDLKLRTGTQRLGCFLLRLIDETGQDGEAALPFPKAILASRLGMTSESLSRALSVLKEHGLETAGNRVIIRDRVRLEAVSRPDDLIDESERDLTVAEPIANT
jgi:CRP/FNR family transcriptional regulator, transcriptional activator FtrB